MRAENGDLVRKARHETENVVRRRAFCELLPPLDLLLERSRQRLDGLDATKRAAREDGRRLVASEEADETLCLGAATLVERPQTVVALPLLRLAGPRVPDEQDRHPSSPPPWITSRCGVPVSRASSTRPETPPSLGAGAVPAPRRAVPPRTRRGFPAGRRALPESACSPRPRLDAPRGRPAAPWPAR